MVIDVSALGIVDSFIGRMLSNTAEMALLMNASVVLVGISPAVAITLVELGLDLGDVQTAMNLEMAIEMLAQTKETFFKQVEPETDTQLPANLNDTEDE